ncbi:hypothetical protein [Bacteroides sp. 224]|uniref:hypothetical protein n=1 Tax=Bacteroides sp. 224 TaxID=2302936 RepID=UPI0013D695B5|nr:hypothetical protein [Bacteroides sp. 224]NDV66319.1 hypothetical protein [Bacteroides sp. 224]
MKTLLKLALLTGVLTGLMACIGDKVVIYDPIRVVDESKVNQKLYADVTEAEFKFIPEANWQVELYEIECYVGKNVPDTLGSPNWLQFYPDPDLAGGEVINPNDTVTLKFKLEPNYIGLERAAVVKITCGGQVKTVDLKQEATLKKTGRKLLNTRLVKSISGTNDNPNSSTILDLTFEYFNAGEGALKDNLSNFTISERRTNYHNAYNYKIYNQDFYEGLDNRRIRIERDADSPGGIFHTGRTTTHLNRGHYVDSSRFGDIKNNWDGTSGDWHFEIIEYMNGWPVRILTQSDKTYLTNDTVDLQWNKPGDLTRIDCIQFSKEGQLLQRYSYAYQYDETLVNKTNIDLNWFILTTTTINATLNMRTIATPDTSHLNLAGLMGKRSKHLLTSAAETYYQSSDPMPSNAYNISYKFDEWGYVTEFVINGGFDTTGTYKIEYVAPPILDEK